MNRGETSHNVRTILLTSLRLAILTVVAGVTTLPLLAQPAPCAAPSVTVTTSPEPVAEDDGATTSVAFEIEVDVGGDEYCFWEITYQTGGGDATPDEDYRPIEPTTECRSGDDTITGSVDVLGDTASELDETFEVQVPAISVGGCANGEPFDVGESATVTIANFLAPGISIDDVEIQEGDEGTTNAVFTVRADSLVAEALAVGFQTEDADATAAEGDYKPRLGSVTIEAVEPYEATITVPITGDTRVEEDETFAVLLTGADGAEIVDGEGVGAILNDDEADTVRIVAAPAVLESASSASVMVERLAPSAGPAQVTVTASDGTATAEADFTPTATAVSWEAGEGDPRTVQIPLLDDDLVEGDETIQVTLSDPQQATLGSPSTIELVVQDDEREGDAGE